MICYARESVLDILPSVERLLQRESGEAAASEAGERDKKRGQKQTQKQKNGSTPQASGDVRREASGIGVRREASGIGPEFGTPASSSRGVPSSGGSKLPAGGCIQNAGRFSQVHGSARA